MATNLVAPNPTGLCFCGCGQTTTIAHQTRSARGWVRGEHVRYIPGHHQRQGQPARATGGRKNAKRLPPLILNPNGICECGCGRTSGTDKWFLNGHKAERPAIGPNIENRRRYRNHRNHTRRTFEKISDFTRAWVQDLRMRTTHCVLCGIRLEHDLDPNHPAYPNLDHIIPINIGGGHVKANVRYICRACNRKRPYDGSDVSS